MKVVAAILFSLIFGNVLFAQFDLDFDVGARAGVPITKPFSENDTLCCFRFTDSVARTFIVGPEFGVTVFNRLRVEVDALHRPLRAVTENSTFSQGTPVTTTRTTGAIWDFPVMANYHVFRSKVVHPYGGVGLVFLTSVSGTHQTIDIRRPGTFVLEFSDHHWFPAYGAQAGLEWKRGHFVIRPEVRYTYWEKIFGNTDPSGPIRNKNQVEFLVGFAFEPSK